jgi:hypothetical protein
MTALARRHRIARELRERDPNRPVGRKTHRRVANRRGAYELPDVTVSMLLPEGTSLQPGHKLYGIAGLSVTPIGAHCRVTITGKNRDWCIDQAKALLGKLGVPGLQAVIRRGDEPGPADSAPLRKGYERSLWIAADGGRYLERSPKGGLTLKTLFGP